MKKARRARRNDGRGSKARKGGRRVRVPPPESTVWPEAYRGKRWKSVYAIPFAGRCQLCSYSFDLPKSRQLLDKWHRITRLLLCSNHPADPGALCEVLPIDTCRNFRAKPWRRPRTKPAKPRRPSRRADASGPVRRIPLGRGLFALVDAADYKELRKYKWYASPHGPTTYATCRRRGRVVYMHHMILRPPKGSVVDHIDGNGLNNRRCNLRICTHQQNQANTGPRGGSSQFVGVYRHGDKWAAGIRCRGEYFYLGLHDDEVAAAKARDRKAYELHGEYAYLNFPEDVDP